MGFMTVGGVPGSTSGGEGTEIAANWAALPESPTAGQVVEIKDPAVVVVYASSVIGWIPVALTEGDHNTLSSDLVGWLDANDITGDDHTAGALATWPSKTGGNAAATNGPSYSATSGNGGTRPAVELDGSTQHLTLPSAANGAYNGAGGIIYLAVFNADNAGQSNLGHFFSIDSGAGAGSRATAKFNSGASAIRMGARRTVAGTYAGVNHSTGNLTGAWRGASFAIDSAQDYHRLVHTADPSDKGQLQVFQDTSPWGSEAALEAVDDSAIVIGAQSVLGTVSQRFDGKFSEVIMLAGSLEDGDHRIDQALAYLRAKWGLA